MLAEKESAAHRTRNRPLCNLKTRKTGTGFYACPLFSILKMLLSLRRRHGTASRKHTPYQYRIFSQGNSVCAYIAFETHIRCKTDNFALFAPPNKKSNLHCPPTKRELAGYDAGIHATDNESLKADLQAAFDRKSVLLKKQEAALNDFIKQTGLTRDRSREQVSAHFDTTKGKVVSFNKSVSQKAILANKRALQIEEEKRIIIEIKAAGIRGTISLHPTVPDLSDFSFDVQHISKRNHNVTKNEAVHFIHNALFSSSVWNGEFVNYFSEEGAAYVDMKNMLIRTAFAKDEFTEPVIKALEVLKKHGKK